MKKIYTAIIGFGLSGRVFHAPFLLTHEGFEIKSVLSSRPEEVRKLVANCKVTSNYDEILSDESIDLVINCGPNHTHYDLTKKALLAGKHVVVEKPFVANTNQGRELIDLAKKSNLKLSVYHNRRWDGDFITVQKLLENGELGQVKEFESRFDRFRPEVRQGKWKEKTGEGTGVLFDLGSHLLDQAIGLFGKPSKIVADIESQREGAEVDDYFHLVLHYKKLRAILHSSSFSNISPRFRIQGSKKIFIKYGLDPQEESLKNGELPTMEHFGYEPEECFGHLIDGTSGGLVPVATERGRYENYFAKLHSAITEDAKVPVDPEDALVVIDIISKIKAGEREINLML